MHRIDTKTAQKDKFGAGKNGFTRGNPQTGTPATDLDDDYFDMLQEELCSVVEASGASLEKGRHDQLLTALRALLLSRKNPFGDIKSDGTVQTALENLGLREVFSGLVGDTRNARMIVTAASATATFTADYVIVEDSDGRQYRVKSFSANINLASTGAGGMDTGTAPASGFVALYAIYNPTNGNKAMLAVNATSAALPEIYGGSNMPSGYTASALLCVVPTDSAGKLVPLLQAGRKTLIETAQLSSTTVFIPTPTALNVSTAVPKNAKSLDGILYLVSGNSTRPVISVQPLSSPTVGVKQLVGGNSTGVNNSQAPFSDLAISTPQTIYWRVSEGIPGDTISTAFVYATAYSI